MNGIRGMDWVVELMNLYTKVSNNSFVQARGSLSFKVRYSGEWSERTFQLIVKSFPLMLFERSIPTSERTSTFTEAPGMCLRASIVS